MKNIPKYLFHRTNEKSLLKIIQDKKILHIGTPASCRRFEKSKFDSNGNDLWKCIFLASTIKISAEMVWCGDIVLKIKTENLDKNKFEQDQNYNGCYRYNNDISILDIVEIIKSNRKEIMKKIHSIHDYGCCKNKG